jgi:hypothetical protein
MDKNESKIYENLQNLVEQELEQDLKNPVLTVLSVLTVRTPSNGVLQLLEKVLPHLEQPKNNGQNDTNEQMRSKCSNYKNFVEFIMENSSGKTIPTIKNIQENFPIMTTREIQKHKKQMENEDLLIRQSPTTYKLA